jgi:hypothetical protein
MWNRSIRRHRGGKTIPQAFAPMCDLLHSRGRNPMPGAALLSGRRGTSGAAICRCAQALPSVMNALVDAASEYGIRHIDMPGTLEHLARHPRGAQRLACLDSRRRLLHTVTEARCVLLPILLR